MPEVGCFGFYLGGPICSGCSLKARCKAILITNGFDIMASLVEDLVNGLSDSSYKDTDRIPEVVTQLLEGPPKVEMHQKIEDEEIDLIELLKGKGIATTTNPS